MDATRTSDTLNETGALVDPHTAVGYAVARQHRRDREVPMVVLATAHPGKFPEAVAKATGERPRLPARLGDLMERAERVDGLPNDLAALETMIDERMALAREPAPLHAKVRT